MAKPPSQSATPGAKPQWSSRFAFLMAAIGSAVGLGNLWRFPFQTGENGGSAFVFIYLICVVVIAYPILIGELSVGRRKGLSAIGSTAGIAKEAGKSSAWGVAGLVSVIGGFLILTTYSVIAGQVLSYSLMSFLGEFAGRQATDAAQVAPLYANSTHALLWHTLFMGITVFVVSHGLKGGIERVVTILMPLFFVMLAGLCVYALVTGAAGETIAYLFTPRFSEVTAGTFLAALGQAFFSIGVGSAIMITYGSFLSPKENIGNSAGVIAGSDTMVAVVAGLMIFPIVFAHGLDPAAGSGLIFGALPAVFSGMPAGSIIGGLFFFLAFIAALTSSISLLMVVTSVGEEQFKMNKLVAAIGFGAAAWAVGAWSVLAPDISPWIDFISGSVALPLGGLLIAVLAGWIVPRALMRDELSSTSDGMFRYWRLMIRYVAPIAVFLILLLGLDDKFGFGLNALLTGGAG